MSKVGLFIGGDVNSDELAAILYDEDAPAVNKLLVDGTINGDFEEVKTGILFLLLLFSVFGEA